MSNLEQDLLSLQIDESDTDSMGDLELFKRAESKKKKRKKNKLFKEIDGILGNDESYTGDDDMEFVANFKVKNKDKEKADGDLFDTDGKSSKKFKNVESKFKPELANLQRILKDNESTAQTIREVLKPLLTSKARGSSKLLADLLIALNSANNNRLAVVKELSSVKKSIYDLKLKLQREEKGDDLGMPADQFGSKIFDELFKRGRANVIDTVNSYGGDMSEFVNNTNGEAPSFDDILDNRLATENNEYRSDDGNKMIEYETMKPTLCVEKSFSTGDINVIAVDKNGVKIDDYPVPSVEDLGKVTFHNDSNTCTDYAGRVYKVIEVA
jgi:hypothetical protein